MSRPYLRRLGQSAGVALVLVALASCGARSGLFVDEEVASNIPDAETSDVSAPPDGGRLPPDGNITPPPIDASEEPVGCVPGTFNFSPATSQLMFVLDRSRSMTFSLDDNNQPPFGEPSRWDALRNALSQTILPLSSQIAMGARFFPVANAEEAAPGACQQDPDSAEIVPALNNAQTIIDVFDNTIPNGGTPSASALNLAAQVTGPRGSIARAMVIATDGAPNCNPNLDPATCHCTAPLSSDGCQAGTTPGDGSNCLDDVDTVDAIQQIFQSRNIPVFVVGIGVTADFATTLDQMAIAGGRPRPSEPFYYPASTQADLSSAFQQVRDSVGKCTYVTPSAPQDPNSIVVTLQGAQIPRDPTHVDGWDWVDQTYGQLQLFGPACSAATPANVGGTIVCDQPEAGVDASTTNDF